MKYSIFFSLAIFSLTLSSCNSQESPQQIFVTDALQTTWAGAAEINHYNLKQKRYGKITEGEAILIFVREPFLKDRQVKDESGKGNFHVLKLNAIRSFRTGAYPYHTMTSTFQPLDKNSAGKALKVTTSIQEWCGNLFMQTNRRKGKSTTQVFSYFEQEEGKTFTEHASTLLEDEIWTALRINPKALPTGKLKIIPGGLTARLYHLPFSPLEATAKWKQGHSDATLIYEIKYTHSERTLAIEIEKTGSHAVQSWKESDQHGLISSGTLKKRLREIDYWNYGTDPKGLKLRNKLQLK